MLLRPDPSLPSDPFDAGPFSWTTDAVRLGRWSRERTIVAALVPVIVGWVPLAVLAAAEGLALTDDPRQSFLLDFGAYGRYLLAAPAFIWAAYFYVPEMAAAAREFMAAGFITEPDRPRYDALLRSTRRLLTSRWCDLCLAVLAYGVTVAMSPVLYPRDTSTWIAPTANGLAHMSLAGWWRTLVTQPLFLLVLVTWLWRYLLWSRVLWRISGFDLRLVAAHPDRLGGLRFVLVPLRGFTLLAFGVGAMTAGSIAEGVVADGQPLDSFKYMVAGQVVGIVLLFALPLVALARPLFHLQVRGTLEYGQLASRVGREFEQRWTSRRTSDVDPLERPDFSAMTDLFAIVANVGAINLFVLEVRPLVALAIATLLPYLPLAFAVIPIDRIVEFIVNTVT